MERGTPGESYIIAGPPATIVAALELAEQITGVPAPRIRLAPALVRGAAAVMSALEGLVALPETMSADFLRVAAGVTYLGSNARARRELGFAPRALGDGLRQTLEYELGRLRK